jgi:hypothetical protein
MDLFRVLTIILANRVHAAVTAAGFGVPAIVVGTDTRARIGEWIGLDVVEAASMDPVAIAERMATLLAGRSTETERLLTLRGQTVKRYMELLGPILDSATPREMERTTPVAVHPLQRLLERDPAAREWRERLGMEPLWVVQESGFHSPERYGGGMLRWTDGKAVLTLPEALAATADQLELALWAVHPAGHRFQVAVNGKTVLETAIDSTGLWEGSTSFPPCTVREIALTSDMMRSLGDSRALGLAVRKIRLPERAAFNLALAQNQRVVGAIVGPQGQVREQLDPAGSSKNQAGSGTDSGAQEL